MLHMAAPTLLASADSKSYDAWLIHIASLTTNVSTGSAYPSTSSIISRVNGISESGVMWGTPYGQYYTYDSSYSRIIQHAMPSYSDFINYAVGREVVVYSVYAGDLEEVYDLNRNNYISNAYGPFGGCYLNYMLYWTPDGAKKVGVQATSVSNYTAPGWA